MQNDVYLRDALTKAGYSDISYDEKTKNVSAMKNGETYGFGTSGLENRGGSLVGSADTINNIVKNAYTQGRGYGEKNKMNVGYDRYNNPSYNGHILDTTKGTNVNGKWYFDKDYLDQMINAVKPQEWENPYAETQKNLLEDLLNYRDFSYDPETDEALKKAQSDSIKLARQDAYNQGRGNTSWMDYQTQKVADDLALQYRDKARQEWLDNRNYLAQLYGLTNEAVRDDKDTYKMNMDIRNGERDYAAQENYRERQLQNEDRNFEESKRQFEVQREQWLKEFAHKVKTDEDQSLFNWAQHHLNGMEYMSQQDLREFEVAMELWKTNGTVPNEWAANILGLKVGTPIYGAY